MTPFIESKTTFKNDPVFEELINQITIKPYRIVIISGKAKSGKTLLCKEVMEKLNSFKVEPKIMDNLLGNIPSRIDDRGTVLVTTHPKFDKPLNYFSGDFLKEIKKSKYQFYFLDEYDFDIKNESMVSNSAFYIKMLPSFHQEMNKANSTLFITIDSSRSNQLPAVLTYMGNLIIELQSDKIKIIKNLF